jgi:putative flippase GtrA
MSWLRAIAAEFAKFGVVGAVCTVIDVGLFNVLHFGADVDPLLAKSTSVVIATTASYLGNRHWSFSSRGRKGFSREYPVFFLLNAVGLGFALACLAVTKYGFGLTGPLALNLAGNVIGMGGATVFRFWSYRRWVFPAITLAAPPGPAAPGLERHGRQPAGTGDARQRSGSTAPALDRPTG